MLYAFKVYYAQNHAGIIRQGLTSYVTKRGTLHCGRITRSEAEQHGLQGHNRSYSRRAWLGRGDRGCMGDCRLNNYNYRARLGPGLRRTAVVAAAERLYRYAHAGPGKLPVGWAARSRWTAEAILPWRLPPVPDKRQCMAFAARRKQNAAQKSDRQPEPFPGNTPVLALGLWSTAPFLPENRRQEIGEKGLCAALASAVHIGNPRNAQPHHH